MRQGAPARKALLALRDPLTRIALALQRLESARPRELRERAEAIQEALGDAEARLGELERALSPPAWRAQAPHSDCRSALAEIHARTCVALAAHSATLRIAPGNQPVPGDLAAVRRAATRLLRVACLAVREGGEITLSLAPAAAESTAPESTSSCARLELLVQPTREPLDGLIDELLERFALAEGAEFEREPTGAGEPLRVKLRLAAAETP
jgi:hypothetical protein